MEFAFQAALRLWMQMVLPSGSKIIAMRQTGELVGSMRNFDFVFSQMLDGGVEILDFQRGGAAVRARFEHPGAQPMASA